MADVDPATEKGGSRPQMSEEEFFVAFGIPGLLVITAMVALVATGLGDWLAALHPMFSEPVRVRNGVIRSGIPRFVIVVAVSVLVTLPYLLGYVRYVRPRLHERGWL